MVKSSVVNALLLTTQFSEHFLQYFLQHIKSSVVMYNKCNVGDFAVSSVRILGLLLVKLQVKSEFLHDES